MQAWAGTIATIRFIAAMNLLKTAGPTALGVLGIDGASLISHQASIRHGAAPGIGASQTPSVWHIPNMICSEHDLEGWLQMPMGRYRRSGLAITASLVLSSPVPAFAQDLPDHPGPPVQGPAARPAGTICAPANPGPTAPELNSSKEIADAPAARPEEPSADVAAPCVIAPPPLVRPPAPHIFGALAVPVGARALNPQWAAISTASLDNVSGIWTELVDQADRIPPEEIVPTVNRWVNWNVRFADDSGADNWSAAADTLIRGTGDCEDFAIAKMALLLRMGIPKDDMFLVIVREKRHLVDHAVLAVRRHGTMQILDNRTDKVLPAAQISDYNPTLSYSGAFAWIYGHQALRGDQRLPASSSR